MSGRPLTGVRVIELAHIMAGPVCGLMLADMGADVVKVERLPGGDGTRGFVPPTVGDESSAFMMLNRAKRGLALDLRRPDGVDVVRRLLREADVVIENFRVGTMDRMGLGWDRLSKENPRLVYCQITGFGRTGPFAERGGFDLIAQGYSGLMSVTGEVGRPPVKVGAPVTDITAGILAAFGIASALFERERTGMGQLVDTSLFEAGITQTYWQSAIALASGVSPGPLGTAHPLAAPYQTFRTADSWINVGASNEATWRGLTTALGASELASDARFATNGDRMMNLEALVDVLSPYFAERTSDDWLEILTGEGVPVGPIASIGEMLEHPQTIAREMVIEVEHSRLGTVKALGSPVKVSRGEAWPEDDAPRVGSPRLGEHTREILLEAGWAPEEVEGLLSSGVALESSVP
jgi:crotonobetainyl-CoA:carnitine CoA-transferase CaiB-like acyl-CoA transferase